MYKEKDLTYVCHGNCIYCLPALVDKDHVCYSKENESIIKRLIPGKNPAVGIIEQLGQSGFSNDESGILSIA